MSDAQVTIIEEAYSPDGMVVGFRCGNDPSLERLNALVLALASVVKQSREWSSIDRKLAGALHLLSFHASGLIEARSGRWSASVDEIMPLIYEHIDEIFGILE